MATYTERVVTPYKESSTGDIQVQIGAFYYPANQHKKKILFVQLENRSTKLYHCTTEGSFNVAPGPCTIAVPRQEMAMEYVL